MSQLGLGLRGMIDVDLWDAGAATDGYALTWDDTSKTFKLASVSGGGPTALNDLTDVTITSVSDDQILRYDNASSQWKNEGIGSIGVHSDVTLTSPEANDFLFVSGGVLIDGNISDVQAFSGIVDGANDRIMLSDSSAASNGHNRSISPNAFLGDF